MSDGTRATFLFYVAARVTSEMWPEPVSPQQIRRRYQKRRKHLAPAVMDRDGRRCQLCGTSGTADNYLTLDHIRRIADGGTNDEDNLRVLCRHCNTTRGNEGRAPAQ